MTIKGDAKFKGKLIFCFKHRIRNLVNFDANGRQSENLNYVELFLIKACKDLDETVQESGMALKSDVVFDKNPDVWFQKWHEEFREL